MERSEAKVGRQEAVTPISLRVTMIMRPEDGVWKIAQRHADLITPAWPAESVVQHWPKAEAARVNQPETSVAQSR
jgi:hypothetical protein